QQSDANRNVAHSEDADSALAARVRQDPARPRRNYSRLPAQGSQPAASNDAGARAKIAGSAFGQSLDPGTRARVVAHQRSPRAGRGRAKGKIFVPDRNPGRRGRPELKAVRSRDSIRRSPVYSPAQFLKCVTS